MTIANMSRELLAQAMRELAPTVLVSVVFTAFMLFGYVMGRIQMARKYSKKNMPDHANKHIEYLALKLRVTEIERDELRSKNEALTARLRGVGAFVFPQEFFGLPIMVDKSVPKNMVILKNVEKPDKKNLKLVKQ